MCGANFRVSGASPTRRQAISTRLCNCRNASLSPRPAQSVCAARQRSDEIVGLAGIDFADEAQSDMQLVVILPARAIQRFHPVDQHVADRGRGPDADEEAMAHELPQTVERAALSRGSS